MTLPQRQTSDLSELHSEPTEIGDTEGLQLRTIDDVKQVAELFRQSGVFDSVESTAEAAVKIIAGQELGVPPLASMRGIYVFDNGTELAAPLMAALIKRSDKYEYTIIEASQQKASIQFYQRGVDGEMRKTGPPATFTWSEAQNAKLHKKRNWRRWGKDMLVWRAMSRGAKRYCAELFWGNAYVRGEASEGADANRSIADDTQRDDAASVDAEPGGREESSDDLSAALGVSEKSAGQKPTEPKRTQPEPSPQKPSDDAESGATEQQGQHAGGASTAERAPNAPASAPESAPDAGEPEPEQESEPEPQSAAAPVILEREYDDIPVLGTLKRNDIFTLSDLEAAIDEHAGDLTALDGMGEEFSTRVITWYETTIKGEPPAENGETKSSPSEPLDEAKSGAEEPPTDGTAEPPVDGDARSMDARAFLLSRITAENIDPVPMWVSDFDATDLLWIGTAILGRAPETLDGWTSEDLQRVHKGLRAISSECDGPGVDPKRFVEYAGEHDWGLSSADSIRRSVNVFLTKQNS